MKALEHLQLLILDFDGVLTDNRVLVSQDGSESVWCHRGDGHAILRLTQEGVPVVVISQETSPVVEARCRKLGIPCYHRTTDKVEVLHRVIQEYRVSVENVAYVGNDVNDLECIKSVGVSIAVADAADEVKAHARLITKTNGGYGAIQEVIGWIIKARNPCLT